MLLLSSVKAWLTYNLDLGLILELFGLRHVLKDKSLKGLFADFQIYLFLFEQGLSHQIGFQCRCALCLWGTAAKSLVPPVAVVPFDRFGGSGEPHAILCWISSPCKCFFMHEHKQQSYAVAKMVPECK